MARAASHISGDRRDFSPKDGGQQDHSLEKDQIEASPHSKNNLSSKWIRDINVRNKITQVPSKPWENSLINLGLRGKNPQNQEEITRCWNLIKSFKLLHGKRIKQSKDNSQIGNGEICATIYITKG